MLTDTEIRELVESGELKVENVRNFEEQLGSVGIDLRVGSDYLHVESDEVHDARHNPSGSLELEPGEFYNVRTVERVNVPEDIVGSLRPRASLSKMGLAVFLGSNVHPGYSGVVEFGMYNLLNETAITLQAGHPVVQLSFERLDEVPEETYAERSDAQYQNLEGFDGV